MKMKSSRLFLGLAGLFLAASLGLEAATSPTPSDHPCQPVGNPPDECSEWEADPTCAWVSTCEDGETCCEGNCIKVDACHVCCGGEQLEICKEVVASVSMSADGFKKVAALLKKAPMVKEASVSLSVKGEGKMKNCCKDDVASKVYTGTGSFSAGVSVELNIPGWAGQFESEWEGIYYLYGEWFVGPIVGLEASGGGSISYEKNECEKTECTKGSGSASVGMTVTFGGKVEVLVEIFRGSFFEIFTHVKGELSASANTSVTASTEWSSGTCEASPTNKVCWGGLTASGQIKGGLSGVGEFSVGVQKELLKGGCTK